MTLKVAHTVLKTVMKKTDEKISSNERYYETRNAKKNKWDLGEKKRGREEILNPSK